MNLIDCLPVCKLYECEDVKKVTFRNWFLQGLVNLLRLWEWPE